MMHTQTLVIHHPDAGRQSRARAKQALLMSQLLPRLDELMEEAAAARIQAPGLVELREWAVFNLQENADLAAESLRMEH